MNTPKFSVIIPTLNEEKFIPKLLNSLTKQTVKTFEVTVVDGGSQDQTVAVVKKFSGKLPLTVISVDKGVSRQRNAGAKIAKANWLVFVDADSVLLPYFFERIDVFIKEKHPKFFTTWLKADSDNPEEAIAGFLLNMSVEGSIIIDRPWAPGPLTVIRKDIFEKIGGYDEDASFGEDHDLSMVALDQGIPFQVFREILYIFSMRRIRKEGNRKVLQRNMKAALRVLLTKRGPKHVPGFIGGGSLYWNGLEKSKKGVLFTKKLERSIKKIFQVIIP